MSLCRAVATAAASPAGPADGSDGGGTPPGVRHAYKSTDPWAVALMVRHAAGAPFARWVEQQVLQAVPIEGPAVIGQDHAGHADASGNVRLTAPDWIRLAVHLHEQRAAPGCWGDYLCEATTTQVRNPGTTAPAFDGHGYFVWTRRRHDPASPAS